MPIRYYIEQRGWLMGGELDPQVLPPGIPLDLGELLKVPGAGATVIGDHECFSNFDAADNYDHLLIHFDSAALEVLRRRISTEQFRLVRFIPRLSEHGYLSLTSVFAIDDSVPLEAVEDLGVKLVQRIDDQIDVVKGVAALLEQRGLLRFPYRYRFGMPQALIGSKHEESYAYGLNQHVLLLPPPSDEEFEAAARAMGVVSDDGNDGDPDTGQPMRISIDGFRTVGGWTVYVWTTDDERRRDDTPDAAVDRFVRLVTLDNIIAIELAVHACGISAATAFMAKILDENQRVTAWEVRETGLVHHRIEQAMILRERELLEIQREYIRGQFQRSDREHLRHAHERAEAALLSAAEGLEAAQQEEASSLTNGILFLVSVLGALTVFTTAIDFAYWMRNDEPPVRTGARRFWLILTALVLGALGIYAYRRIRESVRRRRISGGSRDWKDVVVSRVQGSVAWLRNRVGGPAPGVRPSAPATEDVRPLPEDRAGPK